MIKNISCNTISEAVEKLCIEANKKLPCDIVSKIKYATKNERNSLAKSILGDLEKNLKVAEEYRAFIDDWYEKNNSICFAVALADLVILCPTDAGARIYTSRGNLGICR